MFGSFYNSINQQPFDNRKGKKLKRLKKNYLILPGLVFTNDSQLFGADFEIPGAEVW